MADAIARVRRRRPNAARRARGGAHGAVVLAGADRRSTDAGDSYAGMVTVYSVPSNSVIDPSHSIRELPPSGALFTAVPPAVEGFGTFPVRAFAQLP